MTTFRITGQWEFGGKVLGPIDIEGNHTIYATERFDALTKAMAIFRRHGSHGNVENIICVEVNQDEIDGLYMAHHPAEGPGHLEEECPCLDGGQSVYRITGDPSDLRVDIIAADQKEVHAARNQASFRFLNCNCGRSYPLGHHWESCPGFDADTMDTSEQWKIKPIHTKGGDLTLGA